jgi:hypothetical protein
MKSSRSANLADDASDTKNKTQSSINRRELSKSERGSDGEKLRKSSQRKISLLKVASLFTMSLKLSKSKSCGEVVYSKQNSQLQSSKINLDNNNNNNNKLNGISNDEENVFDEIVASATSSSNEYSPKEKGSNLFKSSLMKPFFGMMNSKNSKRAISSRDINELETRAQIVDQKENHAALQRSRNRNPSLTISKSTEANLKAPMSTLSLSSCKLTLGDSESPGFSPSTRSILNSSSQNYLRVPSNSSFAASSEPSSRRSSDLANYSRLCSSAHSDDKADSSMFISSKSNSLSNMSETFGSMASLSSLDSLHNSFEMPSGGGGAVPIIRVQSYDEAKHYKIKQEEQRIAAKKYDKLRHDQRKQIKSANLYDDSHRTISNEHKNIHYRRRHREHRQQICGRLEVNSKSATNFVSRLNDVCIASRSLFNLAIYKCVKESFYIFLSIINTTIIY